MEHSISHVKLNRTIRFALFLKTCPQGGMGWREKLRTACNRGVRAAACVEGCEHKLVAREPLPLGGRP